MRFLFECGGWRVEGGANRTRCCGGVGGARSGVCGQGSMVVGGEKGLVVCEGDAFWATIRFLYLFSCCDVFTVCWCWSYDIAVVGC